MKILYYYQELPNPMFQWHRTHFIDELSHYGVEFDTFNPLSYSSPEEANEQVYKKAKMNRYDLFFSNTCYYKMLFVETVENIKKLGIPTLTISWDNLMVPYMDKTLAPHFDLVWLTSKDNMYLYRKWGVKCFYAPFAANPYLFRFSLTKIVRSVCFVGNPHGSRAIMINSLTNGGVNVEYYHGNDPNAKSAVKSNIICNYHIINPPGWQMVYKRLFFSEGRKLLLGSVINKMKGQTMIVDNNFLHKNYSVSHDEMVNIYSNSALALSSTSVGHTDILKHPLQWTFLRNFEIPMCGGLQLCKFSPEIASYYEEDKEIVLYRSNEELLDKARFFTRKAKDKELYQMKICARRRSESEHTWHHRFKQAFDILNLKMD